MPGPIRFALKVVLMSMLCLPAFQTIAESGAMDSQYDPLAVSKSAIKTLDLVVKDLTRDREIPILIYLPETTKPVPVVLFSHGLGGSRKNCVYLGKHWAARGYVAVFIQHPGSDVSVWQDKPVSKRMTAMHQAAGLKNYLLRVGDVPAVLDQLAIWNKTPGHALHQRLNQKHIGMSGHSFGAVTTQAVSGQATPQGRQLFTDPRIKAAIAFSPSMPKRGTPQDVFGKISIPFMLMTGTEDNSPIGNATAASRLLVFEGLPAGKKYQLVLYKAEHSAFTERKLPGDKQPRNPNHHRIILALSTAFWDAWLKNDAQAQAWLDGKAPMHIMEKEDRWQKK